MNTPGGRRIFGIENEYGVTCSTGGQRTLTADEVARYLFRKVVAWGRSSNVFLRNGSRLYLDVGSPPGVRHRRVRRRCVRLVTHDRAGERILEGLVADAQQRLADEGVAGDIYVFKNNTDSAGNSYGCHENYLVTRGGRVPDASPTRCCRSSSAGRSPAGPASSSRRPRARRTAVSQRADHIWEGVSTATTRSRPIINTRDEPHADAEHYRRLHVIVGDSNMSESTTMLKVGSGDLVLRMIEAGVVMRDLTLENPIRAIREISHDTTGRRAVRLANGRQLSALDLQREYHAKAAEFIAREGSDRPAPRACPRPLGPHAHRRRDGGPCARRLRDRLGHQVPPARRVRHPTRARPGPPPPRPDRPRVPRHRPRPRPLLPPPAAWAGRAGRDRPGGVRGQGPPSRRPPGPSCAGTSSGPRRSTAATSPSTGCTSSSTTRRSAPCCARTRSSPPTPASIGSSRACRPEARGPGVEGSHSRRCGSSHGPRLSWMADLPAAAAAPRPKVRTRVTSPAHCPLGLRPRLGPPPQRVRRGGAALSLCCAQRRLRRGLRPQEGTRRSPWMPR